MVGRPRALVLVVPTVRYLIPFQDRERGRTVANMNVFLWAERKYPGLFAHGPFPYMVVLILQRSQGDLSLAIVKAGVEKMSGVNSD